jgi:hypothetical protein
MSVEMEVWDAAIKNGIPLGSLWEVAIDTAYFHNYKPQRTLKLGDKLLMADFDNPAKFPGQYEAVRVDGQYFYLYPRDIREFCTRIG